MLSCLPEHILFKDPTMAKMLFSQNNMEAMARSIFLDLSLMFWVYRQKKLVVTDVWRTVESQTKIYGKFQISGHVDNPCRCIDFSVRGFAEGDKRFVENYYYDKHYQNNGDALIIHNVGNGLHYHLQIPRRENAIYEPYYFTESNLEYWLSR